jgi:hypothetical protein
MTYDLRSMVFAWLVRWHAPAWLVKWYARRNIDRIITEMAQETKHWTPKEWDEFYAWRMFGENRLLGEDARSFQKVWSFAERKLAGKDHSTRRA